eukprot:PITA_05453
MLLVVNDKEIIQDLKTQLSSKFDMKDLGAANYILGMEIKRDRAKRKLWLTRGMSQDTRRGRGHVPCSICSAVGSLMYAMVPVLDQDIAHAVGVLSRLGLEIWIREDLSSWLCFNLFGGAVSWMSKKQSVVQLSTTEAEYMAATHASKEAVWLQRLCSSMGLVQGAIRIDCDSQSAIFLAKNPAYHSKTKHIDVQYHFVRDMIEDKKVLLVKVDTLKNTVDALKKSMSSKNFSCCRESMGITGLDK